MTVALNACHPSKGYERDVGVERRGAIQITRLACGSCHEIPGIEEAEGRVGPSLADFSSRQLIAGTLPNTPENLVRYLRAPKVVVPGNAMPDEHLNPSQAREITAYLYSLK